MNYFNYQLFAEESGEATADAAQEQVGEETSVDAIPEQETTPDRAAEFEALINGDYADEYHSRMEAAVQGRVKNLKSQLAAYDEMSSALSQRYGVGSNNPAELLKAINEDRAYIREQAEENGVSEEVQSQLNELKAINARREADEIAAKVEADIERTKALFPDFDIDVERANPIFMQHIKNGNDIESAYKLAHWDNIVGGAIEKTAQVIHEKTVNNIASRAARPTENGATSHAPAASTVNPGALSLDQIEDYIARARRGESITFKG